VELAIVRLRQTVCIMTLVPRRVVLGGLAAIACQAATRSFAATEPPNDPPPFATVRHQFTLLRPSRIAPDIPFGRLDGTTSSLAAFRGKVILLNFWATWCPACRVELPSLDRLQTALGGDDFQVVAISTDEGGRAVVRPFLRGLALKALLVGLDPGGRLARAPAVDAPPPPFALYGMPISFLIGRSGRVAGYLLGEADWSTESARRLIDYYRGLPE
jgi:thiol-disulfide isomerase/thioredoxin